MTGHKHPLLREKVMHEILKWVCDPSASVLQSRVLIGNNFDMLADRITSAISNKSCLAPVTHSFSKWIPISFAGEAVVAEMRTCSDCGAVEYRYK